MIISLPFSLKYTLSFKERMIERSLIRSKNTDSDVIAISESSRVIQNKPLVVDINLPNYSYELCPTKSSPGGTLLYLRNHFSYKLRKEISIYKSFRLESTFTGINYLKKTNIVIGYIYKHLGMNLIELSKQSS